MPAVEQSTRQQIDQEQQRTPQPASVRQRIITLLLIAVVLFALIAGWQLLNNLSNNPDPTVAGHPLSNPHTHLHTIMAGTQPGLLYLGTHFGLFISHDRGKTWPQEHGMLNTMMITSIAPASNDPHVLAVIAIPVSGVSTAAGVYVSSDGGSTWANHSPSGLSPSAYPYTVVAGRDNSHHFYAFYQNSGWYETHDLGTHWSLLTDDATVSSAPYLLTDPAHPDHLLLGGDSGVYESRNDGKEWSHLTAVQGYVSALVASETGLIFCATDQGIYRWQAGASQIHRLAWPASSLPSRLIINTDGSALYALVNQDLWLSSDHGTSWQHIYHFERSDLMSLVIDPAHTERLYAGFFLPAQAKYSLDGGRSWQLLPA